MNITVEKDSDFKDVGVQPRHRSTDKFELSRDDTDSVQTVHIGQSDGKPTITLESAGVDLLVNDHKTRKDPDQASIRSEEPSKVHIDVQQHGYDSDRSDASKRQQYKSTTNQREYHADNHADNQPFDYKIRVGDESPHLDDSKRFSSSWNFDADARSDHSYGHRERFSSEDVLRQKKEILHQFKRLQQKGIYIGKGSDYTLDTPLEEMKYEYERIRTERETDSAVKMYRSFLTASINFCEYANKRYNPYKFNLDGWSDNVNEGINDYDEVFEDLHAKYATSVRLPPEIKLIGMVVGSGIMTHFTNSMLNSSSIPNMDEILQRNPDLRHQFQAAAAHTTAEKNAGLGNIFNMVNSMGGNIPTRPPASPVQRREMRGPTDIDNLVDSFKTASTPSQYRSSSNNQSPPQPATPLQSASVRHDDDTQTINLSEINDDRLSEISDFETSSKHIDILKRPSAGPRANRHALLNKIRTKKKDGGLVVEI